MRVNRLAALGCAAARDPGTFLLLPLPLDLGGRPGTGAGAVWLAEHLRNPEVIEAVSVPFASVPPILCEAAFGRIEPSLYTAATTLQAWRAAYRPLWLLGDHGLSYGPVRAAGTYGRAVTAFIFDAHYDRLNRILRWLGRQSGIENEVHQGNVGTYIGCDPQVRKLVQIGPRQRVPEIQLDPVSATAALTGPEIRANFPLAVEWVMEQLREATVNGDLIVLSIDCDVLDPSMNPAVDHREAGGLTLSELLQLASPVAQAACSVDIAELNPLRDEERKGRRAVLTFLCSLLATATPLDGRGSWLRMMGAKPLKVLRALGPYTSAIIRGDTWLEPNAAEAAVLNDLPVETLTETFTAGALRSAIGAIQAALADSAPQEPVCVREPKVVLKASRHWNPGENHVECLSVNASSDVMAAAGWDHTVYVWPMSDGAAPKRFQGHEAWVVGSAFAPDGDRLATVSDDQTLRIWHLNHNGGDALVCRGHTHWVKSLAWRPDGERLASGSFDGGIGVWSTGSGESLGIFAGHPDSIWGMSWSPDGKLFASCGERGLLRVWDAATNQLVNEFEGHVGAVERCRFDGDGRIWSLGRNGHLLLHTLERTEPALRVKTGYEQTLDLWVLPSPNRVLIAGPTSIRCLRVDTLEAEADLDAGFPVGAIAGWGEGKVAVGGDHGSILMYELP